MTEEQKNRMNELEAKLEWLFRNDKSHEDKMFTVERAFTRVLMFGAMQLEGEFTDYSLAHEKEILELRDLYREPEFSENSIDDIAYLFYDGMTDREKLEALSDAWWSIKNSGYCDAMANRLMSGQNDAETALWEKNCHNEATIEAYCKYLKNKIG